MVPTSLIPPKDQVKAWVHLHEMALSKTSPRVTKKIRVLKRDPELVGMNVEKNGLNGAFWPAGSGSLVVKTTHELGRKRRELFLSFTTYQIYPNGYNVTLVCLCIARLHAALVPVSKKYLSK